MKSRVVKGIFCLLFATYLVVGCGSEEEGQSLEKGDVVEETAVVEEDEVEKTTIEENAEEGTDEKENEVETETKLQEFSIPEAQIATTVSDINGLSEYMKGLDLSNSYIIIYNPTEGYVVNVGDGESFHLKEEDRIFYQFDPSLKYMDSPMCSVQNMPENREASEAAQKGNHAELGLGTEIVPDYSKFDTPHEVLFGAGKDWDEAEEKMITCYLYAPEEE